MIESLIAAEVIDVTREMDQSDPRVVEIRENMTQLFIALDNVGWELLGGAQGDNGPTLEDVKRVSQVCRKLYSLNPLAKRGVLLRVGYIWGGGVDYGKKPGTPQIVRKNQSTTLNVLGHEAHEAALATDGNVFYRLDKKTKLLRPVPISEICAIATDPDDNSHVQYWCRTWTEVITNPKNGQQETRTHKYWYPSDDLEGRPVSSLNGVEVKTGEAIRHCKVNPQSGWIFGLPDLTQAVAWLKAYKEFLEAGQVVNLALARFAWKVTAKTPGGGTRAAAQVATADQAPAGNTAVAVGGSDLMPVNSANSMIDFDRGRALASMIAAGLEVATVALLTDSSKGQQSTESTLDEPTLLAMRRRQAINDFHYSQMFAYLGVRNPELAFAPVRSVPIHRMVQAIVTALSTNSFSPAEARQLLGSLLTEYGLIMKGGVPEDGAWAKHLADPDAAVGQDPAHPGTTPIDSPGGAGAQFDGDHDDRDSE